MFHKITQYGLYAFLTLVLIGCSMRSPIYTKPAFLPDAKVGEEYYVEMRFGGGGPIVQNTFVVELSPNDLGLKWKPYDESAEFPFKDRYIVVIYGKPTQAGKVHLKMFGVFASPDGVRNKNMTIHIRP